MVGPVLGEFCFVGRFIRVFSISAETKMFDNVGNFVEFWAFSEAHTATKLYFHVHDGSARYVNQKTFGTIL